MPTIPLPDDFVEFLRLLNKHGVKYLLIGAYAVVYYGYVRSTGDLDIWAETSDENAAALVAALTDFGFDVEKLDPQLFLSEDKLVRMGHPPFRIEVQMSVSGLEFASTYEKRIVERWSGVDIPIIDLESLKINKRAAGRHQDLDDLENLP